MFDTCPAWVSGVGEHAPIVGEEASVMGVPDGGRGAVLIVEHKQTATLQRLTVQSQACRQPWLCLPEGR